MDVSFSLSVLKINQQTYPWVRTKQITVNILLVTWMLFCICFSAYTYLKCLKINFVSTFFNVFPLKKNRAGDGANSFLAYH